MDATQIAELKAQLKEELQAEMVNDHGEPLDNLWMLLGGILVFFMHTGFPVRAFRRFLNFLGAWNPGIPWAAYVCLRNYLTGYFGSSHLP